MRRFFPDRLPWGRPAVDAIPLPPFSTPAEHDRFTRLLELHVALVDDGGPSLAAKVLAGALETRGPRSPRLTDLELTVALATYFPAPWTPAALAEALEGRGSSAPRELSGGRWTWDFDPDFTAAPRPGGGWEVERQERGNRSTQVLEHDGDLVILWMDHFVNRHAYPYGWRVPAEDAALLAEGARVARLAHAADTGLPYLANWRRERDEALGADQV